MLETFFKPKSVAVIGASTNKEKIGYNVFRNIVKSGYKGGLYPVNPKSDAIDGYKCYKSVLDIEGDVEFAVIILPSSFVPAVVEECAKKRIMSVMIISAGFKETGVEGAKLESRILETIRSNGMRLWGPNCLGLIDTSTPINATFATDIPPKGNIGLVSQSGAICSAIIDWSIVESIGFSKMISMGNKTDLSENDFMEMFAEDEETKVIVGYIESVKNGVEFIRIAEKLTKKKPVVLIKSGKTQGGAKAASSHTGSLAGSERAYNAAFSHCGVIRADTVEELFNLSEAFSTQPLPNGYRVAVVTNAGGPGIIATDACELIGLKMASFSKETTDYLMQKLPPAANFHNPVDVLGDAGAELYEVALKSALKDENVDGIIVILTPQVTTDIAGIARKIVEVEKTAEKPMLVSFMGGAKAGEGIKILRENKVPSYSFPEIPARVMKAMADYKAHLSKTENEIFRIEVGLDKPRSVVINAKNNRHYELGDTDSREIVGAYGIPVPKSVLAKTPQEAVKTANEIGYPVVMKIASYDILHKSDIGGVKVGLKSEDEVADAFELMTMRAGKYFPKANISGVTVQEMVAGGKETIIGLVRDPQFGMMIMFGLGGIYVEVLKDVSFRMVPVSREDAKSMVQEIKSFPLLLGVRGEKTADIDAIVDCILKISQLSQDFPEIIELDINPLKVKEAGKGAIALDVRIALAKV